MEKMDRIFGCRENVSPSYISNETTEYIDDEINETKISKSSKDDKKVMKRKKNYVESLIEVMSNISEIKAKISEQRLELEREKMNNDFKLKMEKFEVERKSGNLNVSNQKCYMN
jgi:predicted RNA-binding protein Jag